MNAILKDAKEAAEVAGIEFFGTWQFCLDAIKLLASKGKLTIAGSDTDGWDIEVDDGNTTCVCSRSNFVQALSHLIFGLSDLGELDS